MEVVTIQSESFQELKGSLKSINQRLTEKEKIPKEMWLDNQELMQLLKISKRTAQHYRDTGLIAFSQVGNKIYYKQSDIDEMLNKHYIIAETTARKEFADETRKLYSEYDLAEFGKYLFSNDRRETITALHDLKLTPDLENCVHHADIENFKHWHKLRTEERKSIIDKANGKI